MNEDGRAAARVCPDRDEPIEIQVMSERFLDIFDARDISATGVGIFVPYRFEGCHLRSPVDLVITLPATEPFLAKGRIIHRTKQGREFFGVEFVDLPPSGAAKIVRYVERRLAESCEGEQADSPAE